VLIFEAISGLAITLSPFHPAAQWTVIVHTIVGALSLIPLALYTARHWGQYRTYAPSHVTVLGYVAALALLLCALSGCIVTGQALFGIKTVPLWRDIHLITTLVVVGTILPHVVFSLIRLRRNGPVMGATGFFTWVIAANASGVIPTIGLALAFSGGHYVNEF